MQYSFLSEKAAREVALRESNAIESENRDYGPKRDAMINANGGRGLAHPRFGDNVMEAEFAYLARHVGVHREALFTVAELNGIKLTDANVQEVSHKLAGVARSVCEQWKREANSTLKPQSLAAAICTQIDHRAGAIVQVEAVSQVELRANELSRERARKRRTWLSDRIEKLVWALGGFASGVASTLLAQWLVKRLGL
jgi:hypothetical protein